MEKILDRLGLLGSSSLTSLYSHTKATKVVFTPYDAHSKVKAYGGIYKGRWSRGYSTTMSLVRVMMDESPWIVTSFRSKVEKNSACASLIQHVILCMEAHKWRWEGGGRP